MHVTPAKVVILGAQGVGKTSFIQRYVGQIFEERTAPTIGASFFSCKINVDEHDIELLIWDTAGQERFRSMAPMYYRNANAAILMFDITSYESFKSMKEWIYELESRLEDPIIMCVTGNKCDMNSFRQVDFREASQYAFSINALYHETSARNSKGVEGVFLDIAQELIKQFQRKKQSLVNTRFNDGQILRVTEQATEAAEEERSLLCC